MWKQIKVLDLPMGDRFIIQSCSVSRNEALYGTMYRGLIERKKGGLDVCPCVKSSNLRGVYETFRDKQCAQIDALNGLNPYVSQAYCEKYRDAGAAHGARAREAREEARLAQVVAHLRAVACSEGGRGC